MDKRDIGVFDSGIGGISVLKKIIKFLPNENIMYFGDTKNIPYGEKTKKEIQELSERIVKFFILNNCKVIVIACNTATIAALDMLKSLYKIPIIGIIDSGVEAVSLNGYEEISVLGTPFTIESKEHLNKIKIRNKKMKIDTISCRKLCPMIEEGWEKFENRYEVLDEYMSHIPKTSDALLLACTHYPFLIKDIQKRFKGTIIDPGEDCAKELFKVLKKKDILSDKKDKGKIEFYVTGDKKGFKEKIEEFLGTHIDDVYEVNI